MGYEYTIKYSAKAEQGYDELLRALPSFAHVEHPEEREPAYTYRHTCNNGQLPNALIELTRDGFYFCDYGDGLEILKELIFRLALDGGSVEVIDHND